MQTQVAGVFIIGLNSLYCIYFGATWTCFSVITSPNQNYVDEIWNISDGPRCAFTQEKWGKSPQGFRPRVPKHILFFCYQCNMAFQPLIMHRFRPFLKQQTWIAFRMRTPVKNFPLSVQGVFQVTKTAQNTVL